MHKKLLYSFIILAMLFGAFGMMGQGGVTPVAAAQGWNQQPVNATGPVNYTPLPHYQQTIGVPWDNAAGSPYHGAFNNTMGDSALDPGSITAGLAPSPFVTYLRIYAEQQGVHTVRLAAGLFEQDFTEIPGQVATAPAAGDPLSAVFTIPANTPAFVVLARTWNFMTQPGATPVDIYMQRVADPSGGLIVQTDAPAGTDAQVYNKATGLAQMTFVDVNGIAWFDVPNGIYNLGFANAAVPMAARYSDLIAGGWIFRQPLFDTFSSLTAAELRASTPAGVAIALNYRVRPADAEFGFDFNLGNQGDGTFLWLTAGPWHVNAFLEQAGAPDYNLFKTLNFLPFLSTVTDFRLHLIGGIEAALVRMCVPTARDNAVIHMEVPPFDAQVFSFFNGGLASPVGCPVAADGLPTQGGLMYLTTNIDYNVYAEVHETSCGQLDQYFLNPVPYPFPITTAGVNTIQWSTIFANRNVETFFSDIDIDGPFAGGLIAEFVQPVDLIEHTRGTWHDASGNHLFRMIIDGVDEFPQYDLFRGLGGRLLALAEDWETTGFDYPDALAGRYAYTGVLNTGGCGVIGEDLSILYAVSPTDTRMLGHWAWSWVMALYEIDYSVGITETTFGPDAVMSRAEMATFLSRVIENISTLTAPAGVGDVFTDVPDDHWAVDHIEFLAALAITGGYGDGTFGPNDPVTRAEMSKFVQLTFRAADMFGWNPPAIDAFPFFLWDTNQNVLAPGTTFVDVPAEHWANLWIEEMWFDGLTDGCRTELSGLAWIHYFCPEASVTRGQMAKFINTALRPNQTQAIGTIGTQWVWPVLSPER